MQPWTAVVWRKRSPLSSCVGCGAARPAVEQAFGASDERCNYLCTKSSGFRHSVEAGCASEGVIAKVLENIQSEARPIYTLTN